MLSINRTNSKNSHFISLVTELDKELTVMDGDKHDYYDQFNKITGIPYVIVGYTKDQAVCCGALKPYNENAVEVKRMYTLPSARGHGHGASILKALENWAEELNYKFVQLETGISFAAANALYSKNGYERIPNYDQYEGVEDSICFRKKLG